jgi:hypothetical protein
LKKRIRLAFSADCGGRTVSGNDSGVVGQGKQARVNGVDDLLGIAPGQVSAPDASGEEGVSGQDHFQRCEMKTNRALGMSGGVEYLGRVAFQTYAATVGECLVGRRGVWSFDAEPRRLRRHDLQEGQVVFVKEDGGAREGFELERTANMIDMGVGDEDLLEGEAERGEATVNAADLIAGVDDDGFTGFLIAQDGAVALQWADGKSLEDHGFIVERCG